MLIFVTAVAVVLVISFLCSIFESVLLSLTRPQVEMMTQHNKAAGMLLTKFKENMDVPIAAILILNTAAHTIGASVAGASYSNVFDASTLWAFSIVFTIAVLLFTEIIPKTVGVSHAAALAAPVAHGINWLTILLRPMVTMSEKISRSLRGDAAAPITSLEEIRLLASLGHSEGVVGSTTAGIIVGATHLRHLDAYDVMLPREHVCFLSSTMDRNEAIALVRESGHSRFPFSPTRDLNDAIGVVLAKDLLYWLLQHDAAEVDWQAIQKEPLIVPRSVPLLQLLRIYQDSRRHLAIVVDEYGSVEGIATLEDVLEEIVGDIHDESDVPVDDVYEGADGSLVVRARVDLRRLAARLGVTWESDVEAATIGGLISEELERIPVAGDSIRWHGYRIEVLRADRRRATLLSVRRA
ncbi:MAG: hemolysin family protein [Gammaproteobacteria bacterium]|nr:hemolysin family protein [Gammaproteobacteria bacterium]